MKIIIVLSLLLSGCGFTIIPSNEIIYAENVCKEKGGISYIEIHDFTIDRIYCNDSTSVTYQIEYK